MIWAVYSLLTKCLPAFPTDRIGAFCLISGALSMGIYFLIGGSLSQIVKVTLEQWLWLVLVGIVPMGAAFFFWDAAHKQGDPRVIGSWQKPLKAILLEKMGL